jgi:hypothetical protein
MSNAHAHLFQLTVFASCFEVLTINNLAKIDHYAYIPSGSYPNLNKKKKKKKPY